MKTALGLLLFVKFFFVPDISDIRKSYHSAASSAIVAKELLKKLSDVTNESGKTLLAYKGATIAILSKFEKKPAEKIKGIKEGAKLIETAAASEPNNIEIRLIRLSVQENVPGIVNYKQHIKDDKAFLQEHFKEQTGSLRQYISDFMKESKTFKSGELE